ncbi:MAG TPA: hypothetical protein GX686_07420 [Paracoccus sp.]|nr:hypothetical protein [Paracoccus sp. (in: a-proteobacteria)]
MEGPLLPILHDVQAEWGMIPEAAQLVIAEALGIDWHETTADGRLTLEPVFCLGLCACGPSAQLDDRLVGRVTTEKLVALAGGVR